MPANSLTSSTIMKKYYLRNSLLSLVCLFLILPFGFAQTIQTNTKPSSIDMQRLSRIDDLVNGYVNKKWLTGAVTLVIKDNQLVQYKGYGVANMDTKKPMANNTIFRIMSQTKAITSAGILILYEQGKLLLDEPIADFIPAFKDPVVLDKFNKADTTYTTIPAKREITIRDLLTHTSGIGYAQIGSPEANAIYAKAGVPGGIGVGKIVLADKIKILGKQPIFHQPGERFTYGLNTDVLGYLVEVLSGMSLDDFFHKRIFEPLGMKDTYFYLPKEKYNRLAK